MPHESSSEPLTSEEAQAFVASVPWRAVDTTTRYGPDQQTADAHSYMMVTPEIAGMFWRFAATIRRRGHRGTYTPRYSGRPQMNWYLDLGDGHVYWNVGQQMCRTLIEHAQHERLEEPQPLWAEEER